MTKILKENGLPERFLMVAESGCRSKDVRSHRGAVGFWQMMPAAAHGCSNLEDLDVRRAAYTFQSLGRCHHAAWFGRTIKKTRHDAGGTRSHSTREVFGGSKMKEGLYEGGNRTMKLFLAIVRYGEPLNYDLRTAWHTFKQAYRRCVTSAHSAETGRTIVQNRRKYIF